MLSKQPLLQYQRHPTDAISPAQAKLGLADRIQLARGRTAVGQLAAKLAKSGLNTPWTVAPKQIRNATGFASRVATSTLSRGASEIARGSGNLVGKLKFW
jgi:hypothetical protein